MTIPDEAVEAAAKDHAPQPGPQYWDFKCLRCDGLVIDHAPFWLRIARKIGATK